jgi:hypothetical protein
MYIKCYEGRRRKFELEARNLASEDMSFRILSSKNAYRLVHKSPVRSVPTL